ncbi:WD repeat-containing protein [Actinidia chinensis var. chinensis]|uniref:WD repeat-containing protein n=1 Tax=Actinidia chinensis var. chinensis TaxID=1590841 RepID=A0A2R6PM70_ACTCC|nr:WD repeat-containing protein [Actinidia chinensis var. chinensis]
MKNFPNPTHSNHQSEPNPHPKSPESGEKGEESEEKPRSGWDFSLSSIVPSGSSGTVSDTLGVVEFDPSGSLLATGGIARKIRVYSLKSLLDQNSDGESCICTPAKLSSLRWNPGSGGRIIGSGDYDGVVMEYDLERRVPVFERDEHGGRRVWSMDYSHSDPGIGASGSDDGTVQMWDPRCEGGNCVASVQPNPARSSVCCVEFNPFGGALLAVGCADRRAYGYDVRRMVDPVLVLDGHSKAVSYVRFLDHRTVVTSGTDGCLKLWHTEDPRAIRTYRGHVNTRRFVGLSAWRGGGLVACGSESNQVFVYDKRWSEPIWVHGIDPGAGHGCDPGFVSSVCWRQAVEDGGGCTLVAGGSDGVLQVFEGKRKSFL